MPSWTPEQLETIERTGEVTIATRRADGSFRPPVVIWAVRSGDDVFVRSVRGDTGGWYKALQADPVARIVAGNVVAAVEATTADRALDGAIDAAYRAKYGGGSAVQAITAPKAQAATVRLLPQA